MIKYQIPNKYCDCPLCVEEKGKQKEEDKMVDKNKQTKDKLEVVTK